MKKGQITQPLLYIAGGIIAALAIYYGVSSVARVKQTGEESSLIILENTIKSDVAAISSQYGSNRTHTYAIGPDFTRICFTDIENNSQIASDENAPAIVRESASDNSLNNVFLLGPENTEAFNAGEISACVGNYKCFDAVQGNADVLMYGGGGFAELDPCGPFTAVLLPRCAAASGIDVFKRTEVPLAYGEIQISPPLSETVEMTAQDLANPSSLFDFSWNVVRPDETVSEYSGTQSFTYSTAIDRKGINETGIYKFIGVATSQASGRQCSITFTREYAGPGQYYPLVEIVAPHTASLNPDVLYDFEGSINDRNAGAFNFDWDWDDESSHETGSAGAGRAADEPVSAFRTHTYSVSGVSRLVKLKVTNSVSGLSSTAVRRYSIGNAPPWIILNIPLPDAVLSTPFSSKDVDFNFTPNDEEEDSLDCQLLLLKGGNLQRIPLGSLPSGVEYQETMALDLGDYFWSVSCSDGISTNTSETRKFTITQALIPNLHCIFSSNPADCSGIVQMLSLSGETNAHLSSVADDYSYKLCCNLTTEGSPTNYLKRRTGCGLPESSQPFIRLSASANAHASFDEPTYPVPLCFNIEPSLGTTISCSVKSLCDSASDETCLLSLSGSALHYTNSHAASCDSADAYQNKICCKTE